MRQNRPEFASVGGTSLAQALLEERRQAFRETLRNAAKAFPEDFEERRKAFRETLRSCSK